MGITILDAESSHKSNQLPGNSASVNLNLSILGVLN